MLCLAGADSLVLHVTKLKFPIQFEMMQHCAGRHGWTKFVSMQNHYSLLYREEEREVNPYCNYTGVGLIPWVCCTRPCLTLADSDCS